MVSYRGPNKLAKKDDDATGREDPSYGTRNVTGSG